MTVYINGLELMCPYIYNQIIFYKSAKTIQWERSVSSINDTGEIGYSQGSTNRWHITSKLFKVIHNRVIIT